MRTFAFSLAPAVCAVLAGACSFTWDLVDLDTGLIHEWRSASRSGDVKTPKSKCSLTLPKRALVSLRAHKGRQIAEREAAGEAWNENDPVFCREDGTMYTRDALNWPFSRVTKRAGIGHWHAHEGATPPCRS